MPTIHRQDGYRFYFYSHEPDEPPHVHIDRGGESVKVWLEPVALARNVGFCPHELTRVLRIVGRHRETFLDAWHEHFRTDR